MSDETIRLGPMGAADDPLYLETVTNPVMQPEHPLADRDKGPLGASTDMGTLAMASAQPVSTNPQSTSATDFLPLGQPIELSRIVYQVLKRLGKRSGESQVYLLQKSDGSYVVLKYYYPGLQPKMHILEDLIRLKHPGLLQILEAGFYKGQFFELLEYASGGDLLQYSPIQDVALIRQVVAEAVATLHFCHQHKIVHRDIKPDNLFFKTPERERVVIGDFGISSKISNDELNQLTSQNRTPVYAAPEVYQSIAGKTVIQPEVDYYCLGMTLLCLWTGTNPFQGMNEFQIMQVKTQGLVTIPADMPEVLRQLIKGLLTVRTSRRWGYPEIQRWLAGETVPVDDSPPTQVFKPFKFGTDVKGEPLNAGNPVELASLLMTYPDKGVQYLQNGAIKNWLEMHGEQESALEISALMQEQAGVESVKIAAFTLNPQTPLLLGGQEITAPEQLAQWIYGPAKDWEAEEYPKTYQTGLQMLQSGEIVAWLKAQGELDRLAAWAGVKTTDSTEVYKSLEQMLRILDPTLAPVYLELNQTALKERLRVRYGTRQDLTLTYATVGPGVPWAQVGIYQNGKRKQSQIIRERDGRIRIRLGNLEEKAYQTYSLQLKVSPDENTALKKGDWTITYKVTYPWVHVTKTVFWAGSLGAALGLGIKGTLLYKYPKPLSSYFGPQYTPALPQYIKDPYLDYSLVGWTLGLFILYFWFRRT